MELAAHVPAPPVVRLLGSLDIVRPDGERLEIGGTPPRVILAMLVGAGGHVVPVDQLIDAIWEDDPPATAAGTLQTYVSRLRRTLGAVGGSIVREFAGYRLDIDLHHVDVHRFEALAGRGRAAFDAGEPATARALLADAEALWRGPAVLEVRDRSGVSGMARRLDERRLTAIEDRVAADLALGGHAAAVAELAQFVIDHPLRERLWELLALAQYRSGMQADALRSLASARRTLVEELGVEPSRRLRELEAAILDHDVVLDLPCAEVAATPPPTPPASPAESVLFPDVLQTADRAAMVGRADELAQVLAAIAEAGAGQPRVVVIEGEAGVGKTRLCEEVGRAATAAGVEVAWGRCPDGRLDAPFWPWLEVLRTLRTSWPERANAVVDQLLDASGPGVIDPGPLHGGHVLAGVLHLLDAPISAPVAVVLEDVQWADDESVELTRQVLSSVASGALTIVVTLRDGADARREDVLGLLATASRRDGTRRLRIDGMRQEETAELLATVGGATVDAEIARIVHERVSGNPFFAIELQRLLTATASATEGRAGSFGPLESVAARAAAAVPVGVRDVIRQRLSRLPAATVELLQLAAVAGGDLDVEILSLASGRPVDACLDDLDVALADRVLADVSSTAGLRFAHALTREVIVDDLTSLRRARTHLAIAEAIEQTGRTIDVERYAEHLWSAIPLAAPSRAADALERAAELALRRFAVRSAGAVLERALHLRSGSVSEADAARELDSLVKLVWVRRSLSGYQGAMDLYPRGAELARALGRADVELEMQWAEWAGHDTACDFERARPIAARFREWAQRTDDAEVAVAGYTASAIQAWHDGDLRAAAADFELVTTAREHADAAADDWSLIAENRVLSAAFTVYVGEQVGSVSDPDAAFEGLANAVSGNVAVAMVWCFGCTSATSAGDVERVERYAERVLAAEAGEQLGFWGSQARMYLGAAMVATGREVLGRAHFDAGFQAYTTAGMRTGIGLMLAAAASAEVLAGDLDRARRFVEMAECELEHGERWPEPYVLLARADLAEVSGGGVDEADTLRDDAERVADHQGARLAVARARAARSGEPWSVGDSGRAPVRPVPA